MCKWTLKCGEELRRDVANEKQVCKVGEKSMQFSKARKRPEGFPPSIPEESGLDSVAAQKLLHDCEITRCGAGGQGSHEESMTSILTVSISFHQYPALTQFTTWNFWFYLPLLSRKKKKNKKDNLSWSSAVLPRPGAPKFSPLGQELIFAASLSSAQRQKRR